MTILRLGLTDQRREVAEATRWLDPDDQELLSLWWLEETGELDRVRARRRARPVPAARGGAGPADEGAAPERSGGRPRAPSPPRLPGPATATTEWDGTPNPLWRKRIARHVRDCANVRPARRHGLLPIDRLLAGLPLLPLPAGLSARLRRARPRRSAAAQAAYHARRTRRPATPPGRPHPAVCPPTRAAAPASSTSPCTGPVVASVARGRCRRRRPRHHHACGAPARRPAGHRSSGPPRRPRHPASSPPRPRRRRRAPPTLARGRRPRRRSAPRARASASGPSPASATRWRLRGRAGTTPGAPSTRGSAPRAAPSSCR